MLVLCICRNRNNFGVLMNVIVEFDENDEAGRYLLACARIRDISTKQLVNRLFETIASDQLGAFHSR